MTSLGLFRRVSPRHHIVGVAAQFFYPGDESWRSDGRRSSISVRDQLNVSEGV